MDDVEQLLTDIHAKLDTLQTPIIWTLGRTKRNEAQAPPHIAWVEPGGDFDLEAQKVGGIGGQLGSLEPHLEVQIWCATLEQCRSVLRNLVIATRAKAGTRSNVEWLNYTNENEAAGGYARKGWQMTARVAIKLPLPSEAAPYAQVATTAHTTVLAVLWGRFNWGTGHTYGGEPVC